VESLDENADDISLDKREEKKGLLSSIGPLITSIILFIALGLFKSSLVNILILVFVIFIHECGHFIGMKLFKYKDVQMFFIPLFGAAVSGAQTHTSNAKKAVVSLLGPLPGILIGIGTGIAYLFTQEPILIEFTKTFIFINAFNLLPFYPLDGGHFFEEILFSRHPKIEIGFKVVATIALGLVALVLQAPILGVFALLVLQSLHRDHALAEVAHKMKSEVRDDEPFCFDKMPTVIFEKISALLRKKMPVKQHDSPVFEQYVFDTWKKAHSKPPSVKATLGFMVLYLIIIGVSVLSFTYFDVLHAYIDPEVEVSKQVLADGSEKLIETQYVFGSKYATIELDNRGYYDGREICIDDKTQKSIFEGTWKNGFAHGEWRFYNYLTGEIEEIRQYNNGTTIKVHEIVAGVEKEIPRNKWAFGAKRIRKKPKISKGFSSYIEKLNNPGIQRN